MMNFKNFRVANLLLGGAMMMGSTSLTASCSLLSYSDRDDFKFFVDKPSYLAAVPEKLFSAFRPSTQENNLDSKTLIKLYEAGIASSDLSIFKEYLNKTQNLDLADQDFTQNTPVWQVLCKSEELSGLRTLNVSYSKYNADFDVNEFLKTFLQNPHLNSLTKIQAVNTNISLETLQKIKGMQAEPYFVRDMEQVSGRYNKSIVGIRVDISGSPLKDKLGDLWDIGRPEKEVSVCYRAYPAEVAKAYLTLEASF